jgi:hypothetical protein
MVHTQVYISHTLLQLFSGNGQRVATTFAKQLASEQIISLLVGGAWPIRSDLLNAFKLLQRNNRFMGFGCYDLLAVRNSGTLLCFAVDNLRFQTGKFA